METWVSLPRVRQSGLEGVVCTVGVPPQSDDDEEGGLEVDFCVPPPSDVEYVIRQFCDPPPSDNEDDSYAETGEKPPAYYPPPDMTYHIKWM